MGPEGESPREALRRRLHRSAAKEVFWIELGICVKPRKSHFRADRQADRARLPGAQVPSVAQPRTNPCMIPSANRWNRSDRCMLAPGPRPQGCRGDRRSRRAPESWGWGRAYRWWPRKRMGTIRPLAVNERADSRRGPSEQADFRRPGPRALTRDQMPGSADLVASRMDGPRAAHTGMQAASPRSACGADIDRWSRGPLPAHAAPAPMTNTPPPRSTVGLPALRISAGSHFSA